MGFCTSPHGLEKTIKRPFLCRTPISGIKRLYRLATPIRGRVKIEIVASDLAKALDVMEVGTNTTEHLNK